MSLTQQEIRFLDRVALQMIADLSEDIEAACKKVLRRDAVLLNKIAPPNADGWSEDHAAKKAMVADMSSRVYAKLRAST
jgi:hypothetical protein